MPYHSSIRTFFLSLLLTAMSVSDLAAQPGGVDGAQVWLQASKDGIRNLISQSVIKSGEITSYNYHPAVTPDKDRQLTAGLDQDANSPMTVFSVFLPEHDGPECFFWSADKEGIPRIITTDRTIADLDNSRYASVYSVDKGAILSTYVRSSGRSQNSGSFENFNLFSSERVTGLSERPFRGQFMEFIAYNRILSEVERMKVETYLAIRYGISRSGMYVDSRDEVLWNPAEQDGYDAHVVALGADPGGNTMQKQSTPSAARGRISFAVKSHETSNEANTMALTNGEFIFIADNGEPLSTFDGLHSPIQASWRVSKPTSWAIPVQVFVDSRQLPIPFEYEVLWMRIADGSGGTSIRRAREADKGIFAFDSIAWDTDNSGYDIFELIPGNEMFVDLKVFQPACGEQMAGVGIEIFGGKAPYQVFLDGSAIGEVMHSGEFEVPVGVHQISVVSADNIENVRSISISHMDGPEICVADEIWLSSVEPVVIENQCGRPGLMLENGQPAILQAPGVYTLIASEGGCKSFKRVRLLEAAPHFHTVQVYPNPALAGGVVNYRLVMSGDVGHVRMNIIDASGKPLTSQTLGNGNVHAGQIRAPEATGAYFLQFTTGDAVHLEKVVITR